MSIENARKFNELLKDEEFQARLVKILDAYEGDRTDIRAFFEAGVAKLAAEEGIPFTYDEAVELAQDTSGDEVSDADLDAIAGGDTGGVCLGLGFSSDVNARCGSTGGYACAFIGVGGGGEFDIEPTGDGAA